MNDPVPAAEIAPGLTRAVLGVTGGIAAYKVAELTQLLVKAGVEVDVVITAAATRSWKTTRHRCEARVVSAAPDIADEATQPNSSMCCCWN